MFRRTSPHLMQQSPQSEKERCLTFRGNVVESLHESMDTESCERIGGD